MIDQPGMCTCPECRPKGDGTVKAIIWIAFLLTIGASLILGKITHSIDRRHLEVVTELSETIEAQQSEATTYILALELDSYYRSIGIQTDAMVIWEVLDEAKAQLPIAFPDGLITIGDIIAIASHESQFNPKARGKAGEVGIFQILDWQGARKAIGEPNVNPYDPRVNTRMGIYVLKTKYEKYEDPKKAIIAYNGVIVGPNGMWSERYWRKFLMSRKRVEHVMSRVEKRDESSEG